MKDICMLSTEIMPYRKNAGVDPKEIGSVGISSQRGTFFAIDENWEPLHNSIVWSDGRAVEEVQWIKENIGVEKYHKMRYFMQNING